MTAKRPMTLDQACERFIRARRRIQALKPIEEAAAAELKAYFRKSKRSEYRGRVGYAKTVSKTMDMAKVRALLTERNEDLAKFQRTVTRETLSILEGAE